MKLSVISARPAAACCTVWRSADCAMRSRATSYGVGSSTGVPLTPNCTAGPRRRRAPPLKRARRSEPCSRIRGRQGPDEPAGLGQVVLGGAARACSTCSRAGVVGGQRRARRRAAAAGSRRGPGRACRGSRGRAARARRGCPPRARRPRVRPVSRPARRSARGAARSPGTARRSPAPSRRRPPRRAAGPMNVPGVTCCPCSRELRDGRARRGQDGRQCPAHRQQVQQQEVEREGRPARASEEKASSASQQAPSAASHTAAAEVLRRRRRGRPRPPRTPPPSRPPPPRRPSRAVPPRSGPAPRRVRAARRAARADTGRSRAATGVWGRAQEPVGLPAYGGGGRSRSTESLMCGCILRYRPCMPPRDVGGGLRAGRLGPMFVAWRDLRFAKGRFALMGTVVVLITLLVGLLSGPPPGWHGTTPRPSARCPPTGSRSPPHRPDSRRRSPTPLCRAALGTSGGGLPGCATPQPLAISTLNAKAGDRTAAVSSFAVAPGSNLAGPARPRVLGAAPRTHRPLLRGRGRGPGREGGRHRDAGRPGADRGGGDGRGLLPPHPCRVDGRWGRTPPRRSSRSPSVPAPTSPPSTRNSARRA